MRQIVILRHAHASGSRHGQPDYERPISPTGEREARDAGQWLQAHAPKADIVLCSPARRTRETLFGVMAETGELPVRLEPTIYEAGVGTLMGLLEAAFEPSVKTVWLVGHNPGLERLVAFLSEGRSGAARGLPPAGVVVLRVADDSVIDPGCAEPLAFWWP